MNDFSKRHIVRGFIIFAIIFTFGILINILLSIRTQEGMTTRMTMQMTEIASTPNPYLETLAKHEKERIFPYRYFRNENDKILPIVAVTGFYRDERARKLFQEYTENGIKIIGVTAYKSFPKPITDTTGDSETKSDPFNYAKNIENWMCCFSDPSHYGFTDQNNLIEMSESDFYDVDEEMVVSPPKKEYDIMYVCLDDDDKTCPANGWNAVNRNFKTAQACLPIFINEYNLKVLVIGRQGCGLEELYGNKIKVTGFLEWSVFQDHLKKSRILFVPNIYDASPRVAPEAIIKNIPVLMNRNILCGAKYINPETGELFTDEFDIRMALDDLLVKIDTIQPAQWWRNHYTVAKMGKKLRDFLYPSFKKELEYVNQVKMFL